jgi:CubicO group peptidase (beta-lactamase class C family)
VYFSIEECDQQTADFELGEGGADFSGDPDDHPYPAFGQAFPNNPPGGENSQDCFPNTIWSDVPVVDALADSGDAAPAWASKFDEIVKGYLTKNQMPGGCQLAIVKAGEGVVYSRAFGVGSMTDPAVTPLSPQNRLYYGSISKTITCVAAMVLVEGGKLSLDEKVLNYLGGDAAACADPRVADVTVKMLMNHTSGMTDGGGMGSEGIDTSSCQATVALLSAMTLARDPGTAYEYANFGANIMGRVIEKASGEEYEAFVCKAVWAPIGCDNYPVVSSKYKMHPGEVPHYTPIRPGDRQAGRDDGVEPWWKYMYVPRSTRIDTGSVSMHRLCVHATVYCSASRTASATSG